jgi:nucleotide-binding universal stress UspA family protein
MEVKRILFSTDFSRCSESAAAYALDLAGRYGASLHVLHVIYDIEKNAGWYVSHISTINTETLYAEMRASAEEEMRRMGTELFGGLEDIEYILVRGMPHEEILKCAAERGMDMIVMGSHGRKGLDRVIFGSTAAKVLRGAACPVLTVRAPD